MSKYYLVPFETNEQKIKLGFRPKYLDEFEVSSRGIQPIAIEQNGSVITKWRQKFYIVVFEENSKIEQYSDVLRIDKSTKKSDLQNLNIDVEGIPDSMTPEAPGRRDKIDKKVLKWLVNKEDVLSNLSKS